MIVEKMALINNGIGDVSLQEDTEKNHKEGFYFWDAIRDQYCTNFCILIMFMIVKDN